MKASDGAARFRILKIVAVLVGVLLAGRVIQIQIFQHPVYEERARLIWTSEIPLPSERGNIFDRTGRPLALSVTTWRVGVATGLIIDRAAVSSCLADVLELAFVTIRGLMAVAFQDLADRFAGDAGWMCFRHRDPPWENGRGTPASGRVFPVRAG